jgi:hypothetical protein
MKDKPQRRPVGTTAIKLGGLVTVDCYWKCPICNKEVEIDHPCCGWTQSGYELTPIEP